MSSGVGIGAVRSSVNFHAFVDEPIQASSNASDSFVHFPLTTSISDDVDDAVVIDLVNPVEVLIFDVDVVFGGGDVEDAASVGIDPNAPSTRFAFWRVRVELASEECERLGSEGSLPVN